MTDAIPPTDEREQRIKQAVSSLFQHCSKSKNPVLSFSRACSKVGFLANDGVRGDLFHLTAALNEQKHVLLQQRLGDREAAREHANNRDEELRAFARAVRRALQRGPEQPLSTPALRERIDRNLHEGQWNRARSDMDELLTRPRSGGPLRKLADYPRSLMLQAERYDELQDRIDRYNKLERDPIARNDSRESTTNAPSRLNVSPTASRTARKIEPQISRPIPRDHGLDR